MDMGILRWASHAAERERERGGGGGRGRGRGMGRGRDLVMICTALPSNRRLYRSRVVGHTKSKQNNAYSLPSSEKLLSRMPSWHE